MAPTFRIATWRLADGDPVWPVPFLLKLDADGGYQGAEFQATVKRAMTQVNVEIVKRSDCAKGFVVLPKRWLIERTFAWLNRCRRLAKDWKRPAERRSHPCTSLQSGSCCEKEVRTNMMFCKQTL